MVAVFAASEAPAIARVAASEALAELDADTVAPPSCNVCDQLNPFAATVALTQSLADLVSPTKLPKTSIAGLLLNNGRIVGWDTANSVEIGMKSAQDSR